MVKKRMLFIKGLVVALFIGLGLFVVFQLPSCQKKEAAPPPQTVETLTIIKQVIPLKKNYIGLTKAVAMVDIRARVEGFLTEMDFLEGSIVKKDARLFVIDKKPFQAQLDLAKGELDKASANQAFQYVQYLRYKDLVAKGNTSKSSFDESKARYEQAQADVAIQKAQVETAALNLGYCTMTAPFDGLIGKRYVDLGNLVGSAEKTLLATVVQLNPIYVEFSPSVQDYKQFISCRQQAPFSVEARLPETHQLIFKGKMNLVDNQVDVGTSTLYMRALVDNPARQLLPGMYVNLTVFLAPEQKVILVPMKAVMESEERRSVYVVEKGRAVARTITIGDQYGDNYLVHSGLNVGDRVITNGLQFIQDGMPVNNG